MSIRLRVALVFTLALAVAFALGSWILVSQLSGQLRRSTDSALTTELAAAGQYFPGSLHADSRLADGTYVIQLVDPSGHVRFTSGEIGQTPLMPPGQLRRARGALIADTVRKEEDQVRVRAGPLSGHPGWVAIAGIPLDDENAAVRIATTGLAIGGSIFVLLSGLGAYWLAAAALSPVERMRREVAALSARDSAAGVQVPRTRDELAALAGTMNELLARLHEALARQRGFVADASHELRTPLAVLGAELELAGRPGRSQEELAAAVANADDEVARLTRLTNDLLLLARTDEGRLPVRPAPTRVRELLARSADRVTARAAAAGVSCVVDAPAGMVAQLDEDRIRQAVDNLIDNALRFAPAGTEISISGRVSGIKLVIEVVDAGPGFPADFLPHAFERFRRPDAERGRSGGGAGLGLAIVAAVAAAHGGRASARNSVGGGAAVRIEVPLVQAQPEQVPSNA